MHDHFVMMAGYNAWANGRIYDAAATLSAEELAREAGVFFGSMIGTLNHVLVGDRIWMRRLSGEGDAPAALDAILFPDLADLRRAREAEDERISAYVAGLDEADLAAPIVYVPITNPAEVRQTRASALAHFFNHQTHHRGHAHAVLSRLGRTPPSLDLLVYQRETGIGMA